ncbi:OsmC family protein [Altererythrobacter sp. Z27]|uniref:OsmC family protein n=1 Tax=Altererythrobacter sp. Z27 TaxID=3461147 RepID=UPI0040450C8B
MTTATMEKPARVAMNGVDVPAFVATLGAVDATREIGNFNFRAHGKWVAGTHSQVEFDDYFGACAEGRHEKKHTVDADHLTVLCGADNGPTPVELVLGALSSCIMAGIGNIASMRQVKLNSVETKAEGDINLNGILGIDTSVRNGFNAIRLTVKIDGDADAETLEKIVNQSIARSAVFDILTNGVPVAVNAVVA